METTQQKTFTRKSNNQLSFVPMSIKENETKFVEILSEKVSTIFVKSKGEDIPCVTVRDLQTNETRVLWLSGKLLSSLKMAQTMGTLKGRNFEISRLTGVESIEVDGDTWDMAKFEIYELQ